MSDQMVPTESILASIHVMRGQRVLLDADLAVLYGVETKTLVRAVTRNSGRFPEDFMFRLTQDEFGILRDAQGSAQAWGGRRYPPYAFTEQGVAMLSSVLRSERAARRAHPQGCDPIRPPARERATAGAARSNRRCDWRSTRARA